MFWRLCESGSIVVKSSVPLTALRLHHFQFDQHITKPSAKIRQRKQSFMLMRSIPKMCAVCYLYVGRVAFRDH